MHNTLNKSTSRCFLFIVLFLFAEYFLFPEATFAVSEGESEQAHNLIANIGVSIILAAIFAYLANLLKQPLLLAYIIAGIVTGPQMGFGFVSSEADIKVISEIGLILLLFMIGLEIDIKELKESGKSLIITGVLQFLLSVLLGVGFFALLRFSIGNGHYDLLYLAVCCAISSTTIVVKLLYDKFELDTLAGRITLGVLVFQDIWVIVVLGIQPNLANPNILQILGSFAKGGVLIAFSFLISKYLLGALFSKIAKLPEMMLVASLGWLFLICQIAETFGLSVEMGALIAGVAISTFPYNLEVIAKIISIRDFFVTLFFVALGMQIPNPLDNLDVIVLAGATALFLIASRFLVVFPILYFLKNGNRVSLLVSINLSQISEFALVLAALGYSMGHIGADILSIVIFVFTITSVASTYMIKFSYPLQLMLSNLLNKIGVRDISDQPLESQREAKKEIAILGFYRTASALIATLQNHDKDMLNKLMVVDFNPQAHRELQAMGVKVTYGDISHMDTLYQAGIHEAKIVVSSIPDIILRGTSNLRLIKHIRKISPHAKIIVTAENPSSALKMYAEGADYVLLPNMLAARQLIAILGELLTENAIKLRDLEIDELRDHQEILN